MNRLAHTGVCEKNDRLIKRLYRAMCLLGRKIQVETHIALYGLLLRRSFFFADTGIVDEMCVGSRGENTYRLV